MSAESPKGKQKSFERGHQTGRPFALQGLWSLLMQIHSIEFNDLDLLNKLCHFHEPPFFHWNRFRTFFRITRVSK